VGRPSKRIPRKEAQAYLGVGRNGLASNFPRFFLLSLYICAPPEDQGHMYKLQRIYGIITEVFSRGVFLMSKRGRPKGVAGKPPGVGGGPAGPAAAGTDGEVKGASPKKHKEV
jgi:hypothetical protein